MGLEAEILTVIGHGKSGAKSRQQYGLNFGDLSHGGKRRASLQFTGEVAKLVGGADSVDLYAPVVEIAGVAGEAELNGCALCEVAIADALHASADEPSLRIDWFAGGSGHGDKS